MKLVELEIGQTDYGRETGVFVTLFPFSFHVSRRPSGMWRYGFTFLKYSWHG